ELDALGVQVVAVTFEAPDRVAHFLAAEKLPFTVLCDPERQLYAAFGLRRGRWFTILGVRSWLSYLRNLFRGRWPQLPATDIGQLGGDVVLGPSGEVIRVYRSSEPADRPSIAALLSVLRKEGGRANEPAAST
ncbi:MAG: peroxiredoxin-like family protein, partial [Chloroflexota bacterium]